jgi:hypothetical protein
MVSKRVKKPAEKTVAPKVVQDAKPVLQTVEVQAEGVGQRLDHFLVSQLDGVSRSRVQLLMEQGDVLVKAFAEAARGRGDHHYGRTASGAAEGDCRRHSAGCDL